MPLRMTIHNTFREQPANSTDLSKIRSDAGNPELTLDDVVVFGKSMIARTDVVANNTKFSRDALIKAAPTFVGKPLNFDHAYQSATEQIGRIFDAWTEDADKGTFLFVRAYAIKTQSDADLHRKLLNRQHREQSMGIDVLTAVCSEYGEELRLADWECPQHPQSPITVTEFVADHLSYVGIPAVQDAGVMALKRDNERLLHCFNAATIDEAEQNLRELKRDAEDGKAYRAMMQDEFAKWFGLANPDATDDEIRSLAAKLSAKEMTRLARIERERVHELLPAGGAQMSEAVPEDDDREPQEREPLDPKIIRETMKG